MWGAMALVPVSDRIGFEVEETSDGWMMDIYLHGAFMIFHHKESSPWPKFFTSLLSRT